MKYFKSDTTKRYCALPVINHDLYDAYLSFRKDAFWTEEEIPYGEDLEHWDKKLSANERHFIKYVLAFFASSDIIVNDNLAKNLLDKINILEAEGFYTLQLANEHVHSLTYAMLIETLIKDPIEKNTLFNALEEIPAVKKKAEWALKWIDNGDSVDNLIAFSIVEGLLFAGSFCAIYYMNSQQKMPALSMANKFIARDEASHRDFAILLYNNYVLPEAKKSNETIKNIINEALEVEKDFVTNALPVSLIGMNADLMVQYLKYVANDLYLRLTKDTENLYSDTNPFPFMESLGMTGKVNFFERRSSSYAAAVTGTLEETDDF